MAKAREIVEEGLLHDYKPGMSATQIYSLYTMFGEDPWIPSLLPEGMGFMEWDYAKARCREICGEAPKEGMTS